MSGARSRVLSLLVLAAAVAAWALGACSNADTIVALTIMSAKQVGTPDVMHVRFAHAGVTTFKTDLEPQLLKSDAGDVLKPSFFERITLPSGWPSGEAEIEVTVDVNGTNISAKTKADVMAHETVAASVMLGMDKPAVMTTDMNDAGL